LFLVLLSTTGKQLYFDVLNDLTKATVGMQLQSFGNPTVVAGTKKVIALHYY